MASFRKKGKSWEASVYCKGIRKSQSFITKLEAQHWATSIEQEILSGKRGNIPKKTFGDLLTRYSETISVNKRGSDRETYRLNAICRDEIARVMLSDLRGHHFAAWRDRRLLKVSSGTILREMIILSHAINISIKDWGWLTENPLNDVIKPEKPRPRDRLITDDELVRLLLVLGYEYDLKPVTIPARVGAALLFAIETAMRAGEIVGLTWGKIDLDKRTALLLETKNGTKRKVPLSSEAIRLLNQVRSDSESVFNLKSENLDYYFRQAKDRAMIEGLHFHDARATAITRLSRKVDILTLARISGHKDLKMLQIYYRETAEDIAKRLD